MKAAARKIPTFFVTHYSIDHGITTEQVDIETRKKAADYFGYNEERTREVKRTRDGSLFVGIRTGMAYFVTEGTHYPLP